MSNIDIDQLLGDNVEKNGIAFSKIDHPLINELKCHWRDKGDFLSRQYTGTISTISKVSQDGKEVLLEKGTLIDEDIVDTLDDKNIYEINVRSAIHCDTIHGICAKCYGRDLGRGHKVDIGESC